MAAGKHREIHDVKQTEKVIPLITGEITFGQHVCELVFGVKIFDLDVWVQIDSFKNNRSVLPTHSAPRCHSTSMVRAWLSQTVTFMPATRKHVAPGAFAGLSHLLLGPVTCHKNASASPRTCKRTPSPQRQ